MNRVRTARPLCERSQPWKPGRSASRFGTLRGEALFALGAVIVGIVIGAVAVSLYRQRIRNPRPEILPQRFVYSLEDYVAVPEEKVGFEPVWQVEIPAEEIRTLCVAGQRAWIAADKRILPVELSADTGKLGTPIELPEIPNCLAVTEWNDQDGNPQRHFLVGSGRRVFVFTEDGKQLAEWDFFGPKAIITDIAISGEEVFVADAGNRTVHCVDRHGEKIAEIGHRDAERGILGFIIPSPYFDLAWGTDGLLRVVNPGVLRIEYYSPEGDLEIFWGRPGLDETGFCGCCNPVHIALFSDGRVVTSEKGIPRVKVYSAQGELISWVAPPEHFAPLSKIKETREEERLPVLDVGVFAAGGEDSSSEWVLVLDPGRKVLEAFRPKPLRVSGQVSAEEPASAPSRANTTDTGTEPNN